MERRYCLALSRSFRNAWQGILFSPIILQQKDNKPNTKNGIYSIQWSQQTWQHSSSTKSKLLLKMASFSHYLVKNEHQVPELLPTHTGEPTGRYLEDLNRNLKVEITNLTDSEMQFDLIGVDASIANALRRILLAEVCTNHNVRPSTNWLNIAIFPFCYLYAGADHCHRTCLDCRQQLHHPGRSACTPSGSASHQSWCSQAGLRDRRRGDWQGHHCVPLRCGVHNAECGGQLWAQGHQRQRAVWCDEVAAPGRPAGGFLRWVDLGPIPY